MKPVTAIATLLVSMATATWLAWPSRNQHGNPDMEELLALCQTDELVTARLYRGNGGATTSYWYSVTLEGDALGKEKQILFSYESPVLQAIECVGDDAIVKGAALSKRIEVTAFQQLRREPIQFWSGKQEPRGIQPSRVFALTAAAVVATAGLAAAVLAPAIHRRRARDAA